jgi:hypothetical protein
VRNTNKRDILFTGLDFINSVSRVSKDRKFSALTRFRPAKGGRDKIPIAEHFFQARMMEFLRSFLLRINLNFHK